MEGGTTSLCTITQNSSEATAASMSASLKNLAGSTSPSSLRSPPPPEISFVTHLCDDTLLRILSYADLPSLVNFARGTSRSLLRRFHPASDTGRHPKIWREAFVNLNFAPAEEGSSSLQNDEVVPTEAIRRRLSLWSALSGGRSRGMKKGASGQCFSLPSRFFHFVPLVPPDMMHFPPASEANGNSDIRSLYRNGGEDDVDNDGDFYFEIERADDENLDVFGGRPGGGGMGFDPPPVEFACDSFSLTSPGTGAEFVLLNPFSGSVELYRSVLDNAVPSDEGLLERAVVDASKGIIGKRHEGQGARGGNGNRCGSFYGEGEFADGSSEVIIGEAIHSRVKLNHCMYDTPPSQVLFSVEDNFELDINEYFGQQTPFAVRGRNERGHVTVDWVGVDSHIALQEDCQSIAGCVIGAARILTIESDRGQEDLACTEVFAWSNSDKNTYDGCEGGGPGYSSKYICRAAGSFYFLDICASHRKLYAAFQAGCCPFDERGMYAAEFGRGDREPMDLEQQSMVNNDGESTRTTRAIFCLPLMKYSKSETLCPSTVASYFPTPDTCIMAQYAVSSFSVDPTGNILVVGTIRGTVEVWCTGMNPHMSQEAPTRLQVLSVQESFMRRHRSMTTDGRHTATCDKDTNSLFMDNDYKDRPDNIAFDGNANETKDDLALIESRNLEGDEFKFPHKHPTSKISQIYLPRHLPASRCGFVTKQRTPEHGTTLLLWQTAKISSERSGDYAEERFHITAMINLPLSAQCHPEVHFDGRRLIIFGKDHIGLIFLVYHVLGTRYDQSEFDDVKVPPSPRASDANFGSGSISGEESGGVIQIGGEQRIRFVNRVRHAGIGGLENHDCTLMAANERFVVANTKTGNLVGGDGVRGASEGLLVIDLHECGCY